MKKRTVTLILCLLLALFSMVRAHAEAITPATTADFDLPCKAAILVDEDSGTVLYEKNADERRPIASITKVMTLLLTFEALEAGKIQLTDIVPISEHAYSMGGSQIWLEPGEQMTLEELLKAICISSANDAAVAVAEFVGGSEGVFVQAMNDRAAELGMRSTHFENACGLDAPNHLSTARDVAVMSREMLLHHKEIANYCTIWMDSLRNGQTQLVNTNKLLKSYTGTTGLKTGTTNGAGVCISASAERDGLRLIAVVLGSDSGKERFAAAATLLDYGFANFESAQAALPDDAPRTLPVTRGTTDAVTLQYEAPGRYLVRKGEAGGLQTTLELPQNIDAPVELGQKLGTVTLTQNGQTLQSWPVTAAENVEQLSFGWCLRRLAVALLPKET